MVILSNGLCFLTGRNMGNKNNFSKQYFLCEFNLPNYFNIDKYESGSFNKDTYINYLFDGELVIDKYGEKNVKKYLFFDTIIFNKNFVGHDNYK